MSFGKDKKPGQAPEEQGKKPRGTPKGQRNPRNSPKNAEPCPACGEPVLTLMGHKCPKGTPAPDPKQPNPTPQPPHPKPGAG